MGVEMQRFGLRVGRLSACENGNRGMQNDRKSSVGLANRRVSMSCGYLA